MKAILKLIPIMFLTLFLSCKKDSKDPEPEVTTPPAATVGTLKIEFEHVVDTLEFNINQKYKNANSDTFQVSTLKYYISNVVITKNDNSTFVEPNSYHLIDNSNLSSTILTLTNVPVGSYKSIAFMLGVDSARNVSGAQTGDLDPAKGMFWTWSSGYIMFKLEGTSPTSGATNKSLTYHIGGFSGANKAQRNFNFSFGSTTANISGNVTPQVHLSVDVNSFFTSPNVINVTTQHTQMSTGTAAKVYADNYADMISFEHVHN